MGVVPGLENKMIFSNTSFWRVFETSLFVLVFETTKSMDYGLDKLKNVMMIIVCLC